MLLNESLSSVFEYINMPFFTKKKNLLQPLTCMHVYVTMMFQVQDQNFITGQNEREETTQDTIVTKSAACASYEINYVTYITATYIRIKSGSIGK